MVGLLSVPKYYLNILQGVQTEHVLDKNVTERGKDTADNVSQGDEL